MKLSELVTYTSIWTDIPRAVVESHSRYLREGGLLTTGGRGLAAPDMTIDDKIALFVAVLGCSTSRTCAKDLPNILALKADRTLAKKDELDRPDFFHRDNLKDALLRMFHNIQDGTVEKWVADFGSKLDSKNHGFQLSPTSPLALTVTFEVDANYVRIKLSALGEDPEAVQKTGRPFLSSFVTSVEFGQAPTSPLSGYSRHTREISYERLKGWGTCLTDDTQ